MEQGAGGSMEHGAGSMEQGGGSMEQGGGRDFPQGKVRRTEPTGGGESMGGMGR